MNPPLRNVLYFDQYWNGSHATVAGIFAVTTNYGERRSKLLKWLRGDLWFWPKKLQIDRARLRRSEKVHVHP